VLWRRGRGDWFGGATSQQRSEFSNLIVYAFFLSLKAFDGSSDNFVSEFWWHICFSLHGIAFPNRGWMLLGHAVEVAAQFRDIHEQRSGPRSGDQCN
jgi:hypothetical protein